jgi:hypothetical protein
MGRAFPGQFADACSDNCTRLIEAGVGADVLKHRRIVRFFSANPSQGIRQRLGIDVRGSQHRFGKRLRICAAPSARRGI